MTTMITATEVRTLAIARKNFDVAIFKDSVIEAAEREYIMPVIGKDLYAAIRTAYLADNLTGENATLVNTYLKPILAYAVVYKCLPDIAIDISSAGTQQNSTEFSNPVSASLRAELGTEKLSMVKTFTDKAIEFIEDAQDADSTAYALYDSEDNVENDISILGGIILDEDDTADTDED